MSRFVSQGWYPNYPPVDTDSPHFRRILSWLVANGAPPNPELVEEKMAFSEMLAPAYFLFQDGLGRSLKVDAVLLSISPKVALVEIQKAFGLPQVAVDFPPDPPPPSPEPPKAARPAVLVGPAMDTGERYYPVAGDDSPDGTEYSDARGRFIKHRVMSPFGYLGTYWQKVA